MIGAFFLSVLVSCKAEEESYESYFGPQQIDNGVETEGEEPEEQPADPPEELALYPELLMEEGEGYDEWQEGALQLGWKYLLAVHTCDVSVECGNPMNHMVRIVGSQDSYEWEVLDNFPPVEGSVPDILFRNGTLYLYAMHYLYRYNVTAGAWENPTVVSVVDVEGEQDRHVDPNPHLSADGRIILLYLSNDQNGDPASCPDFPCSKSFRMAVEKEGSNGAEFELAEELVSVELSNEQRIAADPDLFIGPDGYYLYLSRGQAIEVHRSSSLWGPYEAVDELPDHRITRNGGGVPAGHYDWSTSSFWTFSTKHLDSTAFTDVWVSRHEELQHQDETEFESLGLLDLVESGNLVSAPGLLVLEE